MERRPETDGDICDVFLVTQHVSSAIMTADKKNDWDE